jgi:hypothetical protein
MAAGRKISLHPITFTSHANEHDSEWAQRVKESDNLIKKVKQ